MVITYIITNYSTLEPREPFDKVQRERLHAIIEIDFFFVCFKIHFTFNNKCPGCCELLVGASK